MTKTNALQVSAEFSATYINSFYFSQNFITMKKILSILVASILLFSCNSATKSSQESKEITLEELVASATALKDELVTIEGMVTHVCKHGGQKMFLTNDSQDIKLLVRVSSSIPEFDVALEGSNVQVTGKLMVSVLEAEDPSEHRGEGTEAEEEDCAFEADTNETSKDDACTTKIEFHVEAASYKEII